MFNVFSKIIGINTTPATSNASAPTVESGFCQYNASCTFKNGLGFYTGSGFSGLCC